MWIHIPLQFCPCVQEQKDLSWDLNSISQTLAQSAMWRSKPMSVRSWKNACEKKSWLTHLSGQTLSPLTASRGVDLWIASLRAIRANLFLSPVKNSETKTPDTCGQKSPELSVNANQPSVSLKTLAPIYEWALNKSTMTYEQWVTALRAVCSQRKKSVVRIRENDYSSWPTVLASCGKGISSKELANGNPKFRLDVEVLMWPTTTVGDASVGEILTHNDRYIQTTSGIRRITKTGENRSMGLARTAKLWPTATVTDATVQSARSPEQMIRKDGRNVLRTPSLAESVLQPKNFPDKRNDLELMKNNQPYETRKMFWPTPRCQEPGSSSEGYGKGLKETVQNWRTPNATDGEGGLMEWQDGKAAKLKLRDHSVHAMVCQLGHQDPMNTTSGRQSQLTLNPLFTEWLMGWPIGWTEFEPVATAWSRWWQRMRSEFFALIARMD